MVFSLGNYKFCLLDEFNHTTIKERGEFNRSKPTRTTKKGYIQATDREMRG